jgi:iron complex outermembrane receptor protein
VKLRTLTLALLAAGALPAVAQTTLDPVVVTVERSRQSAFDAPAAISAVTGETLATGGLQVNLSEALNRVPGISILNRQNYAQDLQLSIRGFGSRSTFGIRGVRLIVDGIPATMPDGQGQASNIALGSAARIEVLRGPLAQLYGNAAGGVVQVFTESDAREPVATGSLGLGSNGVVKLGAKFAAGGEKDVVVLDASRWKTDGWRDHSAAERTLLNAKWQHEVSKDTRFSLVANLIDQPESQDPLGLTRAAWEADPRQVAPLALIQDARKSVSQQQLGFVLEHALAPRTQLTARVYAGTRSLENALSIPPEPQFANTSSGGIVEFERDYAGVGVQVTHTVPLGDRRSLRLTGGVELDRMEEDRQGYFNDGGVRGVLKRDELNRVQNSDAYLQAAVDLSATVTATAGVRTSRVAFRTSDRFVRPGDPAAEPPIPDNPDDSGRADYRATNPVLGIAWRATPALNLYANAGRGFETPTFTEVAYRPGGATGLNVDLNAARSRHAEIGAKWRPNESHRIDVALFDISTRDEIVVASNQGGRSTFKNAGRTSRRGLEASWLGRYGASIEATLSATALRARFDEAFVSGSGPSETAIPAGNKLPGTPDRNLFAELVWKPKPGLQLAGEVVHTGKLYVNDANADAAPAATVLNLRAAWQQQAAGWTFRQLLRLDNATDKRYAGSVIVNEANQRFFEPALPRNWSLGLTASHAFR